MAALVMDASNNNDKKPTLLSTVATEAVLSLTAVVSTTFSGEGNFNPQLLLDVNVAVSMLQHYKNKNNKNSHAAVPIAPAFINPES